MMSGIVRCGTPLGGGSKAKVCWQIDNRKWKEALDRALR